MLAEAMTAVMKVIYEDAATEALNRLELAYGALLNGNLTGAEADLRWAIDRITAVVDRQLATAEMVLTAPRHQKAA